MLDRVGYRLRGGASVELVFEGSFARSQSGLGRGAGLRRPRDGHGAATGAPLRRRPGPDRTTRCASTRCGASSRRRPSAAGPRSWHLVESGGNGVALLDYDGDGRLDIYTVSAFDLDERNGRARVPHRNALYRNLGGMRFENVAAEGRRGRRGLGLRRVRRRLRRRRPPRPLRDQLRPQPPVPQQGRRHVRGSGGHGRAWRPTAGAPAAPSSTRTGTATSTCTWRATSPPPGRRSRPPSAS